MTTNPKREEGGAAFPVPEERNAGGELIRYSQPGMMLRDWFAGMALQGLLASGPHDCKISELAMDAMAYADAMLAERKK